MDLKKGKAGYCRNSSSIRTWGSWPMLWADVFFSRLNMRVGERVQRAWGGWGAYRLGLGRAHPPSRWGTVFYPNPYEFYDIHPPNLNSLNSIRISHFSRLTLDFSRERFWNVAIFYKYIVKKKKKGHNKVLIPRATFYALASGRNSEAHAKAEFFYFHESAIKAHGGWGAERDDINCCGRWGRIITMRVGSPSAFLVFYPITAR